MENHAKTLNGLHILVVEDEAIVAMMLEDMLLDFGCRVDLAPSIKSALAAIRDHPPDGVLLDMNIHGQQTTAVAEELLSRSVPFLLVTGYGSGNGDPPAIKTAQRLQKPFSQDDLGRRMGKYSAHPTARQHNARNSQRGHHTVRQAKLARSNG